MCISLGNETLLEYYFILTKISQKFKSKSLVTQKKNQGINLKTKEESLMIFNFFVFDYHLFAYPNHWIPTTLVHTQKFNLLILIKIQLEIPTQSIPPESPTLLAPKHPHQPFCNTWVLFILWPQCYSTHFHNSTKLRKQIKVLKITSSLFKQHELVGEIK